MNGRRGESPERLLDGDATAFERRVLEEALARGPSQEASLRMARALGVGVTTLVSPPSAAVPSSAARPVPAAAPSSTATWLLIPAAVLALSVAGLVVGTRGSKPARSVPAPTSSLPSVPVPATVSTGTSAPGTAVGAASLPSEIPLPAQGTRAGADLRGEIELVDGARSAMAERSPRRALEILRRYESRYPRGNFDPEATAVKVEALMQLGRADEARALAVRFLAHHAGTLLGDRVAAVAGLSHP